MKTTNPKAVHEIEITASGTGQNPEVRCRCGAWRYSKRVTDIKLAEHEWFIHYLDAPQ